MYVQAKTIIIMLYIMLFSLYVIQCIPFGAFQWPITSNANF